MHRVSARTKAPSRVPKARQAPRRAATRRNVAVATPRRAMSAAAPVHEMTIRQALNEALDEEITRDSQVVLLGEEVAQYDGAYKISKGLLAKHGKDRVIDTPITEAGFTGLAVGAAFAGVRPICEFMTFNFALQSIDHIVNSAAKTHYMSGGKISVPIVFRGCNGPAAAVGAQHSQCFAAWYGSVPGLKVVAPYDAEDSKGLLKAAVRDNDPVICLEAEMLYGQSFPVPPPEVFNSGEFVLPIGKAKIQKEGSDITIVSYSKGVHTALAAAKELEEKHGVSAEVINLRTIRPLDKDTILQSVGKTGRLLTVEEGWIQSGVGSEIVSLVAESETFFQLDCPPQRIATVDTPAPYAYNLEDKWLPQPENVVNVAKQMVGKM